MLSPPRPAKFCYRFVGTSSRGLGHRSLGGAKAPRVWTSSGPFATRIVPQFLLWTYEEHSRKTGSKIIIFGVPPRFRRPQGAAPRTGSIANTGRISVSSLYSPAFVASGRSNAGASAAVFICAKHSIGLDKRTRKGLTRYRYTITRRASLGHGPAIPSTNGAEWFR